MNLFGTKNTISTVENTEESAKKDMEQTIDALPLKDKEDIINLINFWLEDDGGMDDIRYWDKENEKKWKPIHNFIYKNRYEYRSRFAKQVSMEKAKFANEYNNKKTIAFIDTLLKRGKNDDIIYPETNDKVQKKKYEIIGYLYNDKESLEEIKNVCEKSIEQKGFKQENVVQKAKQRSKVNDLKAELMA